MLESNYFSYKDPAARVVLKEDGYFRYIHQKYKLEYDHLMQSGLYNELVSKDLLIAHKEIKTEQQIQTYKLIYPEQIYFQSYPFEWSYSQWKKVVLAFLKINQIALQYGMILKDATPYNFYLRAGKAIMFDTSSFIFFIENNKWLAYRQFCEEFLSPIALMHYSGQRWSKLSISHLNGFPLEFVSNELPVKSWFNLTTLLHIHVHAKFKKSNGHNHVSNNNGFTVEKIKTIISMLQDSITSWEVYRFKSHWSGYYKNNIESCVYLKEKEIIIEGWIKKIRPKSVLDLGANTGKFSFLASKYCSNVLAIESDEQCVDEIENEIQLKNINNISTIVGQLSELTPNLGLLNKEFKSIYQRAKSELVLGLALIHHLSIGENISLKLISELFAEFSTNYAIVEFIPKNDNKVKLLLLGREDIFHNYNEECFEKEFEGQFELIEVEKFTSSMRKLYLWKKK